MIVGDAASIIGCHKSTISRELSRNGGRGCSRQAGWLNLRCVVSSVAQIGSDVKLLKQAGGNIYGGAS